MHRTYQCLVYFFPMNGGKEIYMKLSNGSEVIARRYQEQDDLFLRADRIGIPASITAVEFYKKQGYDYKNGIIELDDEGHYRLEKFNVKKGID